MKIRYAAATHVGSVRTENQDAFVLLGMVGQSPSLTRRASTLLGPGGTWSAAVLDGMGGYAGGALASAVGALRLAHSLRLASVDDDAQRWSAAYTEASNAVAEIAARAPDLRDMGATAAAVLVGDGKVVVTNVGDARVYRLWKGYFTQLSEDDRVSPENHAITQALGGHLRGPADPHHLVVDVDAPTRLLLCSDGLSDYVAEEVVKSLLAREMPALETAELLVDAALDVGAPDNTTVVVADVEPEGAEDPR